MPEHPTPPRRKHQRSTNWDELGWGEGQGGVHHASYRIGDPDDETAPLVAKVSFPPGHRVEPHTHDADYTEIILEGSQQIGRHWHHAGDVRIVKGGTAYGPLVAGPEGTTVLIIFRSGSWLPTYVGPAARTAEPEPGRGAT